MHHTGLIKVAAEVLLEVVRIWAEKPKDEIDSHCETCHRV